MRLLLGWESSFRQINNDMDYLVISWWTLGGRDTHNSNSCCSWVNCCTFKNFSCYPNTATCFLNWWTVTLHWIGKFKRNFLNCWGRSEGVFGSGELMAEMAYSWWKITTFTLKCSVGRWPWKEWDRGACVASDSWFQEHSVFLMFRNSYLFIQ